MPLKDTTNVNSYWIGFNMTKLGKALIKGLEEALKYEKGDIELRKTRIEVTADGKIERDYGKEDLNKKPEVGQLIDHLEPGHRRLARDLAAVVKEEDCDCKKENCEICKKRAQAENVNAIHDSNEKLEPAQKKEVKTQDCDGAIDMNKSVVSRWEDIKKALNSDKAIIDLDEAQTEEEAPPEGSVEPEDQDATHEEHADAEMEAAMQDGEESGEEQEAVEGEDPDAAEGGEQDESEQVIMQALADEGYSEAEIRHIVHGHAPPQVDPMDQAKIDATNSKAKYDEAVSQHDLDNKKTLSGLDADHRSRMNDAEYEGAQNKHSMPQLDKEHKQRMLDLEYEQANSAKGAQSLDITHKKRMLDLEYEMAAKEKEIELEHKKKELEMKGTIKEEDARESQKERQMKRDAKTTSEKEKKGKNGTLSKAKPMWSRSDTGQLTHPEHGHVNVIQQGDKFHIRHAPQDGGTRTISSHGSKEEAKTALLDFMKNPKGMTTIPGGTVGGVA